MGVGEEALGAHLASEGWSLKPGVLAHFGEREDLASARNALLDTDLRRVGEPIVRAGDAYLAGPVVLQVVAVRDISRPARDSRDPSGAASAFGNGRTKGSGAARTSSTKTKSSRMLRVELTDGDARLVAVEHEPLRFVKDEASVPPGSKVLVPKDVVVRKVNGVLLLRGDDEFVPLGGRVASLFRDWERARARRGRDDTGKDENSAGKDAPAYRPYDPGDTAAVEAAAEKRRAEAKRVADEAASAAVSAAAAAAAAEAESRAAADSEAAFVPRRRPALPPTRAQRAAAVASGEALPRPGEPMPLPHPSAEALATISAENENENENETKAPVEARARPALPPRRREAPPAAAPPVPPDADARRRERLLSRLVEPSGPREAGGGERGEGRGGGGRGRGGRGRGGRGDKRGGRGRGRGDDDDDDGLVTFEQHVSRRGRGDDDASEALARRLHRELNVDAARDASSDLAASLFAFSRPVADDGGRGDRGGRGRR